MALLTNKLKTRYKDWIENMCKSNHCPKKTFERPGKSGELLHKATLNIASKSGSLKVKKKKKRGVAPDVCTALSYLRVHIWLGCLFRELISLRLTSFYRLQIAMMSLIVKIIIWNATSVILNHLLHITAAKWRKKTFSIVCHVNHEYCLFSK